MAQAAHIEVLRAFWLLGQTAAVGTRHEVGRPLGLELVSAGKARWVDAPAPSAAAPAAAADPAPQGTQRKAKDTAQ